MQTLTNTMIDAIRGTYQVPLSKMEIYNQDGTLAGTILDVEDVEVNVASSRKILRTFKASLNNENGQYTPDPDQYERNYLWYNKTVKIYYGYVTAAGDEWLPQGVFTLDYIKPEIKPDGSTLEIGGQDLSSKMVEDKFDDTYTIEDAAATESANHALATSGASASSTSNVAAGDEIQSQARIHYVDNYATINGIQTKVTNDNVAVTSDINRLIDGDVGQGYVFSYDAKYGETVSLLECEIFVDLQSAENVQTIDIQLYTGTTLSDFVYVSADNQTWTSYNSALISNPSGQVRYIKFRARSTGSQVTVTEIKVKTSNNFTPSLAIDGDAYSTHWRPKALAADADPKFTVDLGASKTLNVVYLYWGNDSFDFWNRVNYYLDYSTDGSTWTRITDLNGLDESDSLFGDVEHCFSAITARYIRVNIKDRNGICKLRHIKAQNISATQTIDKAIKDIAASSGVTNYRIPVTRRFIEKQQAEIGREKLDFCGKLADSVGWVDPYMDETGYLVTGPRNIDPVHLAWVFDTQTDNIFSFAPRFSNDVYNVIVVVGKASDKKAIVSRAIDDNPLSPTYIGKLGRRVQTYEGDSYNTQDKADQVARQKLFERSRFKHQTSLPVTAHPGLQHDDVVQVTVTEAKIENQYYHITGFVTTFKADSAEFNTTVNISLI